MKPFYIILIFISSSVTAFDNDELEIFDLVEEVNQINKNFYEYLELKQDASTNEIRKAYRKLSLVLHPDKNEAEDASLKFRWLAAIYEILKDSEKRAIYDRVLVEGLPDWRSPVFYYRRMRKIGLAEGLAYLFVIFTVFQYCIYWAHYWEKQFTLSENISSQMGKKSIKKTKKATGKTDQEIKEMLEEQELEVLGPKPTMYDTLPFQTVRFGKFLAINIPLLPWTLYDIYKERAAEKAEEERLQKEAEDEVIRWEEEKKERKERKKEMRKRIVYDEKETGNTSGSEQEVNKRKAKQEEVYKLPKNANQIWTDADLAKLAKLIKKYPAGTPDRWDRIAEILERLPTEVTKMAKKIKDNAYMVPVSKNSQGITGLENDKLVADNLMEENYQEQEDQENDDSEIDSEEEVDSEEVDSDDENYGAYTVASKDDFVTVEVKSKAKTKGGKQNVQNTGSDEKGDDSTQCTPASEASTASTEASAASAEDAWSQGQQKALESALIQFPKGSTERWERIANKVPGKTKDLCIQRFKALAEMVKKKREAAE